MQATLGIRPRQARPRGHLRSSLRQHARQLRAVAGELLALVSLSAALMAGLAVLVGVLG